MLVEEVVAEKEEEEDVVVEEEDEVDVGAAALVIPTVSLSHSPAPQVDTFILVVFVSRVNVMLFRRANRIQTAPGAMEIMAWI